MRLVDALVLALGFASRVLCIGQVASVTFSPVEGGLQLAGGGIAPVIRLDSQDWPGVIRAANDLATDFGRVGGKNGTVSTSGTPSTPAVIIAGTIGKSPLIDGMVSAGKIDVSSIKGNWESFSSQLVANPIDGVASALVIVGSDKRGTIYGLYDVSEQIGVSPWYWWADVPPKTKTQIYALNIAKKEGPPSVKYRGIFLNDEQPALTNWVNANYPKASTGMPGFNSDFHSRVFELLLRLKANYFWPTMWNSMFYLDDTKNGPLADSMGIVMGTSHTEPMARADKEKSRYNSGAWDWKSNQANVKKYMQDGLTRAKNWETLWTLGMRGDGDTASPSLDATSLAQVIQYQQSILKSTFGVTSLANIPQMWCLYKEVGGYYQNGMTVPNDIVMLWSDDNVGNIQRLPVSNEVSRPGGAGVYYHFDYVGSPRNYKWINTIQLTKTWQQMHLAHEKNAKQIWIVNVGDLKPLEIPINHFIDMGWDMSKFQDGASTDRWLKGWAAREFGESVANATAAVMSTYGRLIVRRKYELLNLSPFMLSTTSYDEAERVYNEWVDNQNAAQKIYDSLDTATQNAFFEMVLHPTMAGRTVQEIYIKVVLNQLYIKQKRMSANKMAADVKAAFTNDGTIASRYHKLLNGKWNHMMDQLHLGYNNWQDPGSNTIPSTSTIASGSAATIMGVTVQGSSSSAPDAAQTLMQVDPYTPEQRYIDIFARADGTFTYTITTDQAFVKLTPSTGTVSGTADARAVVQVDWAAAPAGLTRVSITVTRSSGGTGTQAPIVLTLPVNKLAVPADFHGFVESGGAIAMEVDHYTAATTAGSVSYAVIPDNGRTSAGVILLPVSAASQTTSTGPKLSYDFYAFSSGVKPKITVHVAPSFNHDPSRPLKYAVSVDSGSPMSVQPVAAAALGTMPSGWDAAVQNGARTITTEIGTAITAGKHTVNLWILEPGLVVQRIIVDLGGLKSSYLGPLEAVRV